MVTRIIAGFAGSLTLKVPRSGTRPTSDRVREAIFSSLESLDAIAGARVLDLYAGTGALGLEAASRGAASVTLVERSADAARVCRENAARVMRNAPKGSHTEVAVKAQSVKAFLESSTAGSGNSTWDVVFVDPPYDVSNDELQQNLAGASTHVAPDAIIVVERATSAGEPTWPRGIRFDRSRRYGDTTLWWATSTP